MAVQPHHVHTLNMVQYARHMCSALHEVSEVTQALCNEFSVSIRTQVLYCHVLLRSSDTLCDGIDSGMSAGPRYSDWPRIKAQGRGRGKGGGGGTIGLACPRSCHVKISSSSSSPGPSSSSARNTQGGGKEDSMTVSVLVRKLLPGM